jgi:hypothetical protein
VLNETQFVLMKLGWTRKFCLGYQIIVSKHNFTHTHISKKHNFTHTCSDVHIHKFVHACIHVFVRVCLKCVSENFHDLIKDKTNITGKVLDSILFLEFLAL